MTTFVRKNTVKIKGFAKPSLMALGALLALSWTLSSFGHCQIPCGIYDDAMRFDALREHFRTIEKSMNQIRELSAKPGENANQLIRWVANKEKHADEAVEIVTWYFMQQRIAPVESGGENFDAYQRQLMLCHSLMVEAMKAKQTTDLKHVENLRKALDEFESLYFSLHPDRRGDQSQAHQH